ncbi:G-protein coupled receptor 161-like [Patiria miniata]|uniref:G-protein coupled receptors family 1 profile domain-containing protein n=1 Tax=Patiria miniata TaxID=46514 RepID=A0A914A4V6_PATMI|nr:G-protein coupled receptor 161-like [Patiria miniata]
MPADVCPRAPEPQTTGHGGVQMGLLENTRLGSFPFASMSSTSLHPVNATPSAASPIQTADSAAITIFQITSLMVILIAAFLGNGVIFLVFVRKPSLLSVSNRFVLHLAICNFLMCVVVMPPVLVSVISTDWMLKEQSCIATGFLNVLLFAAIILTLVMITVDRYVAVMLPLRYYIYMTARRAALMILLVWIMALALALPPVFGWNSISYHHHRFICTAAVPDGSGTPNDSYEIYLVVGGFAVPLISIASMYGRMYLAARDLVARDRHRWFRVPSSEETTGCSSTDPVKKQRAFTGGGIKKILRVHIGDEWRTAQTTLMVMLSFVVSWLPYYVVGLVEAALDRHVSPFWEWIPLWLALSSSAFNPYVYVFRSASMRHHAFSLFGLRRHASIKDSKLFTEA